MESGIIIGVAVSCCFVPVFSRGFREAAVKLSVADENLVSLGVIGKDVDGKVSVRRLFVNIVAGNLEEVALAVTFGEVGLVTTVLFLIVEDTLGDDIGDFTVVDCGKLLVIFGVADILGEDLVVTDDIVETAGSSLFVSFVLNGFRGLVLGLILVNEIINAGGFVLLSLIGLFVLEDLDNSM